MALGTASASNPGTLQTSFHGHTRTVGSTVDTSADGFTGTASFTGPSGPVATRYGGSSTIYPDASLHGLNGVTIGYGTVTTPDSKLSTGDVTSYISYGGAYGLQYVDYGTWGIYSCQTTACATSATLVYGGVYGGAQAGASLTAQMPALSGYATWWGGATGTVSQPGSLNSTRSAPFVGDIGINVNFATSAVTGAITRISVFNSTDANIGTLNDITLTGTMSGSTFSGTVNAAATDSRGNIPGTGGFNIAGASGTLSGGFYGPNAQEAGGTFYLTGGGNGSQVLGGFGASRGTSSTTWTQFLAADVLTVTNASYALTTAGQSASVAAQGTADTSPAGFTGVTTSNVAGAGAIVAQTGGDNNYTASGSAVGQTGVVEGNQTIISSADSNIAVTGGGNYQQFGAVVGLKYSDFGVWTLSSQPDSAAQQTPYYVGSSAAPVPGGSLTAAMPTTGSATFNGATVGYITEKGTAAEYYGAATLTANFASGKDTITGALTSLTAWSLGSAGAASTRLGTINSIAIAAAISGATYSGTATAQSGAGSSFDITGATGALQGGFYGPNAAEMAGIYQLSGNGAQIVGSFGAQQTAPLFSVLADPAVATGNTAGLQFGAPLTMSQTGTTIAVGAQTLLGQVQTSFDTSTATTVNRLGATVTEYTGSVTSSTDSTAPAASPATLRSYGTAVGLQYSDFGSWNVKNAGSGASEYAGLYAGAVQGGAMTAVMPTTGTATFSGGATGSVAQPNGTNLSANFYGSASMTANFATGGITGSITGMQAYVGNSATTIGTINAVGFAAAISGSTFAGTTSVTTGSGTAFNISGAVGQVKGGFYGPNAAEAAGVFNLTGGNNGITMTGAFGVKQPTPSDRRLKQDIAPAGMLANGVRLYAWRYLGGHRRFVGVMAQDLAADPRFATAVRTDVDGLMRVDYAALGYAPHDAAAMASEGEAAVALWRAALH